MAALKAIKVKIRSIDKTRKVTKAMEAVSAAKMRKAQVSALGGRTYARAAVSILERLSASGVLQRHALAIPRPITKALYIVITSDKGLAGSLNSAVLKAVSTSIQEAHLSPADVHIIAIGRKANEYFTNRGYSVDAYLENNEEVTTNDTIARAVTDALSLYRFSGVDTVRLGYQNFISTFEQKPMVRTIFPLMAEQLKEVVEGIAPAKGAFAENVHAKAPAQYAIEPSAEEVLEALLPRLASVFVYHALLESRASEHSARMVAMKSASDKARDLMKEFTLDFNKARQAGITREVSEIIGGIETMTA